MAVVTAITNIPSRSHSSTQGLQQLDADPEDRKRKSDAKQQYTSICKEAVCYSQAKSYTKLNLMSLPGCLFKVPTNLVSLCSTNPILQQSSSGLIPPQEQSDTVSCKNAYTYTI